MQVLSKSLVLLLFMLSSGSAHMGLSAGVRHGTLDEPAYSPLDLDLIHSPVHLPPRPDPIVQSRIETDIDEEETDSLEKPLSAFALLFEFDVALLSVSHFNSCSEASPTSFASISANMRC
jgi:hypothetical protein